jgi:CHAT domain-containing protein
MIETEEELIREYVDPHHAAGRALPVSEKDPVSSVPKTPEKAYAQYFRSRALPIAILLIIVISSLAWFYYSRNSIDRRTTAALDEAYTSGRPLESRITGLKYAPFTIRRGEDKEARSDDLRQTELNLLNAVIKDRSAGNLHALGRFYLAKRDFKNAVEQLEGAQTLAPDDARILSDLGTAYLEKSRTIPDEQGGQQLKMRAIALEKFEKAVEADPKMPEAVFNRSICRQLLVLPFQTRQSWQDYLDLDHDSAWAEEARGRLARVETTPPGKNSDELLQDFMAAYRARDDEKAYQIVSRNREMITGKLIPQRLAKLITESDGDEKTEYLSALEYIGKLENERSGDPFFAEMAGYYSSVSGDKLPLLRQAQDAVFHGYGLSASGDHKGALADFQSASAVFQTNGDKWNAGICGYWIGYTLNRQNDLEKSASTLESLSELYPKYKWLSAQYFAWLVHNMIGMRQFSKAIEYNKKAAGFAGQTGDLYLSQKTLSQKGEIYRILGQYEEALDFTQKGLELGGSADASPRQKWRDIDSAASLFFEMKMYGTSAAYQKEAIELAAGDKTFLFQSSVKLGQIYGAHGRKQEALAFFDQAVTTAESFTEGLRMKSAAQARLKRAHLYRESGDCVNAGTDYNEALAFYDNPDQTFSAYRYDAHRGRLQCYLKNNDRTNIEAELPVILGLFREYRSNILEEEYRNSFFGNEQDVYDIAIDYKFGSNDFEAAFDYSEESRARSLLDMQASPVEVVRDSSRPEVKLSAAVTEPLKLNEMQPQLPANVQVVQYSVLKDKTLIWVISREGFTAVKTEVPAPALHEKVLDYTGMLINHYPGDADKINSLAKELYRILLEPIKDKLDPNKQICIIPDKVLFRLPFSTLISIDSGKYFLAEHSFVSAPSMNIFLNSTRKASELTDNRSEAVLSIGNPSFNKNDFPRLADLDSAGTEAVKIAEFYHPNLLFTGKDAAKEKITANIPNADVIHFGGHYIVNERSPLLSGFVLSENPVTHKPEDSMLMNYEILGDKLSNTRLIVLAACETGLETYYDGEGMIGSSRTFLAAGVPLVVASQWPVDTKATTEIMIRFHRYRKTGNLSTVDALRRAQLDMLEGDSSLYRDPYYWAGFVTFGGYAQF